MAPTSAFVPQLSSLSFSQALSSTSSRVCRRTRPRCPIPLTTTPFMQQAPPKPFPSSSSSAAASPTNPPLASTQAASTKKPKAIQVDVKKIATTVSKKGHSSHSGIDEVLVLGLSHHTASVSVREQLSIPESEWGAAAQDLVETCDFIKEAAILSTCNRFEIYAVATGGGVRGGMHSINSWLSRRSGVCKQELRGALFMLGGAEAVWHLMRVTAGLDSLVVGEGQILAQVKRCYEVGQSKEGSCGKVLTRLLNVAVAAGKRVRTETGIAKGAVSISSAAVELAEMKCEEDLGSEGLEGKRVMILGAGKMSRLLVQHLGGRGIGEIDVVNRSRERMEELAKMFPDVQLNLYGLDDTMERISKADIVFTSTAATDPILFKENVGPILNDTERKVIIDISVPRNVSDDVNDLNKVSAYNVDDLKHVVAKNQAKRRRLVLEAEKLLHDEQACFDNWHHSLGCVPAITKLQIRAESIRSEEFEKVKGKLANLNKAQMKAVEQLSKGIINKMLHSPMVHLRGLDDVEERKTTLKNLEALFKL